MRYSYSLLCLLFAMLCLGGAWAGWFPHLAAGLGSGFYLVVSWVFYPLPIGSGRSERKVTS